MGLSCDNLLVEYHRIWERYKSTEINAQQESINDKLIDRGFAFQFDEEIKHPDVLFVGINPSYSKNEKETRFFYTKKESLKHPYFKPFKNIQDALHEKYNRQICWTHMDLLAFRQTKQSFIKKKLFPSETGKRFLVDQLEISKKILEHIHPKVMVVSNTMARELLGRNRGVNKKDNSEFGVWMGLHFKFDESIGTDVIVNHETLNGTKVFFTSMLSGQRALDNGTKQRLIWHINEVLKMG